MQIEIKQQILAVGNKSDFLHKILSKRSNYMMTIFVIGARSLFCYFLSLLINQEFANGSPITTDSEAMVIYCWLLIYFIFCTCFQIETEN